MTSRALLRVMERERQAFQAERAMLLETICRLAGQQAAPTEMDLFSAQRDAAAAQVRREAEEADADLVDYDQLPDSI